MIFVFGSNESGIHGAGAALAARNHHGARDGQGFGYAGNSFAIPTKDWRIQTLPIQFVHNYVLRFIVFARFNPNREFQVTALGCGLAGLNAKDVAPMFNYAPANCQFDEQWLDFLPKKTFWGTF